MSQIRARSVECRGGQSPMDEDEVRRAAKAAWDQTGKALLDISQVKDPIIREAIIVEATKQLGPRA